MARSNLVKFLLFIALLVLSCEGKPQRNRDTDFGVLDGVLAGAAISEAMQNAKSASAPGATHHHYYPPGAVALPVGGSYYNPDSETIVETGTPDPNGCVKQLTRKRDPNDPKSYIETLHLICPTIKQFKGVIGNIDSVPVMKQPYATLPGGSGSIYGPGERQSIVLSNSTFLIPENMFGLAPSLTISKGCLAFIVVFYSLLTFF